MPPNHHPIVITKNGTSWQKNAPKCTQSTLRLNGFKNITFLFSVKYWTPLLHNMKSSPKLVDHTPKNRPIPQIWCQKLFKLVAKALDLFPSYPCSATVDRVPLVRSYDHYRWHSAVLPPKAAARKTEKGNLTRAARPPNYQYILLRYQ